MPYGLTDRDMSLILEAVQTFPEVAELILFGSRAKGTEKRGSDVDLAIKGASATYETAVRLAEVLNEEKPLPYFFDVILYHAIAEPRLIEHIDRAGIVIYSRQSDHEQEKVLK